MRLQWGLAAVLLVAAALRLSGLHWDAHRWEEPGRPVVLEEQHLHPDERFLTMVTDRLRWPDSPRGYLDTETSPLNPHRSGFFAYGTFPVFLTKAVGDLLGQRGYDRIHLVGRVLAACADLVTVLLTFILGRRLYGPSVGLLGALLLAVAVLPIQQAHFYTVDPFATTFVMLALAASVRVLARPRAVDYAWLGVALGAGLACKAGVLVLGVLAAAAIILRERARPGPEGPRPRLVWLARAAGGLGLTGAATVLAFRVLQPYAFLGPGFFGIAPNPDWAGSMRLVADLVNGLRDFPPGHQWTDRTPLWFPWKNMVLVGMGPALGLAAWGGFVLAGVDLWRRRDRSPGRALLWAWVLVFFAYQGSQWVTSLRYLLPIYPALALFAADLLVRVWRRSRMVPVVGEGAGRWRPVVAAGLVAVVVGGTLAWTWAFTSIYRRPHSRIEASRWIYSHVPPGTALAVEHWDDGLPLPLFGRHPSTVYRRLELPNYAEDTPQKLELLLGRLEEAEYVILSSNRLVDSIPRLPMRYPMTTLYYRYLLSGELGFQRVAEFTAYPRLFGIELPDQGAEEAFSVYDHPRVQIFRKTATWTQARARLLLDQADWEEIAPLLPREAGQFKNGLLLDPATRAIQRDGGTWSRQADPRRGLYDPSDWANRLPVLAWALALALLGVLAFPLTALAFGGLEDRGWLLAKAVGLLLAAFGAWWLASLRLVAFSGASVALVAAGLAALSALAAWWQRHDLMRLWRERRALLLAEEALFWLLFGGMLLIRWLNPDLWHPARGGEKPMDFAYLNAVLKSGVFPPYDPWFAGGHVNYYYFGFVLVGALVKLTGIVPSVAYNLAIPTFFALTGAGAFTAAAALVRALHPPSRPPPPGGGGWAGVIGWGSLGVLYVIIAGTLVEVGVLADAWARLSPAAWPAGIPALRWPARMVHGLYLWLVEGRPLPVLTEWWYWPATRAIPHAPTEAPPITEFPFFTFLFGDLHAHMLALPYTLLVLAGAVHLAADGERLGQSPASAPGSTLRDRWCREAAILGLLALVTGALSATNTWDFPTSLVLVGLGLGLREIGRRGLDRAACVAAGWRLLLVVVLGQLLFVPFTAHFGRAYGSVEPWTGSRTPVDAYLGIHGFFLFGLTTYLLLAAWRRGPRSTGARRALGAGLVLVLLLSVLGQGLLALLSALAALAWREAVGPERRPVERLIALLILLGVALSGLVELVVVRGDVGRMNTVFKLYLQIWVLWGVAAVAGAAAALRAWGPVRWRGGLPRWWATAWVILLAGVLLYPVLATPARLRHRFDPTAGPGLDGEAYLGRAVLRDQGRELALAGDAAAIRWLRENVVGSPVVLEASLPPYGWGSRVSVYTGLPTVLGWAPHQQQQRAVLRGGTVARRLLAVRTIYTAPEVEPVLGLLRRYQVGYVYVGPLERLYYAGPGLDKFESARAHFERVFENPQVRIYRVVGA